MEITVVYQISRDVDVTGISVIEEFCIWLSEFSAQFML